MKTNGNSFLLHPCYKSLLKGSDDKSDKTHFSPTLRRNNMQRMQNKMNKGKMYALGKTSIV